MSSTQPIQLNTRTLKVELTSAATAALAQRHTPLYVQMELYFSCLLRLKVRFYESLPGEEVGWIPFNDKLAINFRPVMTARCDNDYEGSEPPLTDFPLARESAFTPRWLQLDFRQGQWCGEFGYQVRN